MDPVEWYRRVPVVSRLYLTCSVLTTAACALELVSPFTLYFNYRLIVEKGQFWRLLTNFLFFGQFGPDFFFHMYFLYVLRIPLCDAGACCRGRTRPSCADLHTWHA